tara:strand:+ start:699 stop:923 length:225 start_codon:yes stop_codon:yes gene_type:complete
MPRYKNLDGNSGVSAYEIGSDSIAVAFGPDDKYLYTYASAGKRIIEKMKKLAVAGRGLSTYISQTVKEKFEKKL